MHPAIERTLFVKRMFSSCHKLLFIKRMHLIGVAFYEPNLDRLESMWSPGIFGEMVATNNAVMQEDRVSDKSPALVILSASFTLKLSINRAS